MDDREVVSKKFLELIQIFKIGVLKPMEKKYRNLTPTTGTNILFYISTNGSCTMGDITRIMACSKQQATQMVDKLIKNGYVTRGTDKEDRRKVWVSITPDGEQLINEIMKSIELVLSDSLDVLEKDEVENFSKAIDVFEYSFKKIYSLNSNRQ